METTDGKEGKGFSSHSIAGSFRHAFSGIAVLLKAEKNARIHLVILTVVTAAGIILKITPLQWIAVTLAAGIVIASEAFNTAVELLCDAVMPEYDPAIKKAKDLAAAGVLVSAIASVVTGLIVFIPAFLSIL